MSSRPKLTIREGYPGDAALLEADAERLLAQTGAKSLLIIRLDETAEGITAAIVAKGRTRPGEIPNALLHLAEFVAEHERRAFGKTGVAGHG